MASMKDVAKLAGVSGATVSRVINGSMPVDTATRERVQLAIQKLDYRPNLLAKGLRSKSGHLIGLVLPEIVHYTFASFVQYIEECCVDSGYNLIIGNHKNNPDLEESFIDNLIRRHVDGIIFSRVSDDSRALQLLGGADVPVVVVDRTLDSEKVASVVLDNRRAGMLAGEHLAALGHKQIACVTGPLRIALCRERLHGFVEALSAAGIGLPQERIIEGDFKFEAGLRAAEALFADRQGPTAIWAQNDLMAVGLMRYLNCRGILVPGDVAIVGMDDVSLATMISPSLTTVVQPFAKMSSEAVGLLLRQIASRERLQEKIVVQPTLAIRETTEKLQ